jgi:hypothetical protein
MAVRPTECFFLRDLGICGSCENASAAQQEKKEQKVCLFLSFVFCRVGVRCAHWGKEEPTRKTLIA